MFLTPIDLPVGAAARPLPATPGESRTAWMAPGTCGEFVQGRVDGVDFLINSPIDRYAGATVRNTGRAGITVRDGHLFPKVVAAVAEVEARFEVPGGFEIALESDIPQSKGMASSTADLVAAIGAMQARCSLAIGPTELAQILTAVEPSDCTHLTGVALVGHLCGQIFGRFRAPSSLRALVVDCGGEVDTVRFDRSHAHRVYARNETPLRAALHMARRGLMSDNAVALAHAATISARLSQEILPKAPFHDLVAIAAEQGALGVNCAHSGSVLGVLYRPEATSGNRLCRAVEQAFGNDIAIVGDHRIVSGGIHVRNHR